MDIPLDEFDDEEITLVDGIPTCPKCNAALVDKSKLEDEFQTLRCSRVCGYGRVRVRPNP